MYSTLQSIITNAMDYSFVCLFLSLSATPKMLFTSLEEELCDLTMQSGEMGLGDPERREG